MSKKTMVLWSARIIACVVLALSTPAVAQEIANTSPEDSGDDLISSGLALRKLGKDRDALALFDRAVAVHPTARAVAQIALAHQALGEWVVAAIGLEQALRLDDDPWIVRRRAQLEGSLDAVRAHVGSIEIESNVQGAEVFVDGVSFGRLPFESPLRVVAGALTLEVRAPGYGTQRHSLNVSPTIQAHETFTFVPLLAVDERPKTVGATTVPGVRSQTSSSPNRTPAWIALVGASVLASGGMVAAIVRERAAEIYDDDSKCGPQGALSRYDRCGSQRDIGSTAQTITIVAFAGSAAASALSAWFFLRRSGPPERFRSGSIECRGTIAGIGCDGVF
jgi:hypothetical protein